METRDRRAVSAAVEIRSLKRRVRRLKKQIERFKRKRIIRQLRQIGKFLARLRR
jgi:hypothetical protein